MGLAALTSMLAGVLPTADIISDESTLQGLASDWTGRWHSTPTVALRPRNLEQLRAVLLACKKAELQVVVRGGNTGLVGGAVGGESAHALLLTEGLREIVEFDSQRNQLRISAGFKLAEVQNIARECGLIYPVDLAARESATIGGNVATNAGGVRVVAYGNTGDQVVDVKAIGADGEVFDARNLIGSEGRFGVITEVTLQLRPERVAKWTALAPIQSVAEGLELGRKNRAHLTAAEIFQGNHAAEVAVLAGLPALPPANWWLLLEGDDDPLLADTTLFAMQQSDVDRFWKYRESHTEAISRHRNVLKIDSSVPVDQCAQLVDGVERIAKAYGMKSEQLFVFGHLLVGNLHLAFTECEAMASVESEVMNLIVELGGSVAGEHGVGVAKIEYLDESSTLIRAALKNRFDPTHLFWG